MQIMVVDDSRTIRQLISGWVEGFGYEVHQACDGVDALEVFHRINVDVVLTNWFMPRMDGMELCWHLRANSRSKYIYLILMTAMRSPSAYIEALDVGADDLIYKPLEPPVLQARLRAAGRILLMQQELARVANMDSLTGAMNRRLFESYAAEELARATLRSSPLTVLMADIDHFKRVNDTYGHAGGDEALRHFVSLCRRVLRRGDVFGRLGGEEFAIILPDTSAASAVDIGERLRGLVAETPAVFAGHPIPFTVSLGVSWLTLGDHNIDDLLKRADVALYRAKNSGRNRVVVEPDLSLAPLG
ncbi:MAG: diguanylate cyclase [Azospirillaceae bacterium]|nr:diguanylate cyclase [Azospirillaceae bacterium]